MTIKNKDFVTLFEILNKYFNAYINQADQKKTVFIENIKLYQEHSKSLKKICVPYNDQGRFYELWINESPHYNTEYVFFYNDEKNSPCHYFFKDLEKEIQNSFVLDCYNILLELKAIKFEKF